jgi:hypothetical protein
MWNPFFSSKSPDRLHDINMILRDALDVTLRIAYTGVATITILSLLAPSNAIYTPETARVHQVLGIFRQRGQLFIKTFPPLSYYLTMSEYVLVRLREVILT